MENNDLISIPKDIIRLIANYLREESIVSKIINGITCTYDRGYYIIRMAAYYENAADIDITFKFAGPPIINPKKSLFEQDVYHIIGDEDMSLQKEPLKLSSHISMYYKKNFIEFRLSISEFKLRELFLSAHVIQKKYPAIYQTINTKDIILFREIARKTNEQIKDNIEFKFDKKKIPTFGSRLSLITYTNTVDIEFNICITTRDNKTTNTRIVYIDDAGNKYHIQMPGMIGIVNGNEKLLLYLNREMFNKLKYR